MLKQCFFFFGKKKLESDLGKEQKLGSRGRTGARIKEAETELNEL